MPLIRQKFTEDFYPSSEFSKFVIFFPSDKYNTKVPLYIRFGVKSTWRLYCVYFSRFHWWIWPTDGVVSYTVCCIFHCCYVYGISLYCVCSDIFSYWMQIVITCRKYVATDIVLFLYKTPKTEVYVSVLNYIATVSVCLCLLGIVCGGSSSVLIFITLTRFLLSSTMA